MDQTFRQALEPWGRPGQAIVLRPVGEGLQPANFHEIVGRQFCPQPAFSRLAAWIGRPPFSTLPAP